MLTGPLRMDGHTNGSHANDPRKAHTNKRSVRMGFRIDPYELTILDYSECIRNRLPQRKICE
jgi:hypothetical protein